MVHLQRRVPNAETIVQQRLQLAPAPVTIVIGRDDDVRGQCGEARRDLPHVQVVHLDDPRLRCEGSSDQPERSISAATVNAATASTCAGPPAAITTPATIAATDPYKSVSTCARAPSMFRLRRSERDSAQNAAMFTNAPTTPTTTTICPSTVGGEPRRPMPSTAITPASTNRAAPLICADTISARPKPNVKAPAAGRAANRAATSASPIEPASVSMCAASDSSASDPARMPATTSTHMKPAMNSSARASQRRSASWQGACECPARE
jgi:hypothetical protein